MGTRSASKASMLFQSTRPRGARQTFQSRRSRASQGFNPRAHAGRDGTCISASPRPKKFQSTRPRGARPVTEFVLTGMACFNPRAHAGRDWRWRADALRLPKVSIHAPTRGATVSSQLHEDKTKNTRSPRTAGALLQNWGVATENCRRMSEESEVLACCEPARVQAGATRSRAATQRMSGPFRSSPGLAPTCSTLVCQFLPR